MPIEVESPEELGYGTIANNLAESSFSDQRLADLGVDGDVGDLLLQYGDHRGLPALRELIAGTELDPGDLLVTAGAAAALFIVATSLLQPGDHALIVRPNYATNVETPRAIGADAEFLDLRFEDGWRLDPDRVAAALRARHAARERLRPAQPDRPDDGRARRPRRARRAPPDRATARRRDLPRARLRRAPRRRPRRCPSALIGVSSLSKAYGLPGLRIGWIACRDRALAGAAPRRKRADPARRLAARRDDGGARARRAATPCCRGCSTPSASAATRRSSRMVRRAGALRVAPAAGRRRLLPAAAPGARRRPRRLLRRAAAAPRHLRRPRPLVRAGPPLLPARLRLAGRRRSCGAGSTASPPPRARPSRPARAAVQLGHGRGAGSAASPPLHDDAS